MKATWTSSRPRIDGQLTDACWQHDPPITKFWSVDGSARHNDLAWVKVAYDIQHIYFAGRIKADTRADLWQGNTKRDIGVWGGHCVQMFLQPAATSGYYDFIVNSINTQQDTHDGDSGWDAEWPSATYIPDDATHWQFEMAIPFAALALSQASTGQWRLNPTFVVPWKDAPQGRHLLTWSPAFGNFHNPSAFGHLLLDRLRPNDWRYQVKASAIEGDAGQLLLIVETQPAHDIESPPDCDLHITATGPTGNTAQHVRPVTWPPRHGGPQEPLPVRVSQEGRYRFEVALREKQTGRVIAHRVLTAAAPPACEAWLDQSLYTDQTHARLTVKAHRPQIAAESYRVTVRNKEAQNMSDTVELSFDPKTLTGQARLEIADLAPGRYTVAILSDSADALVATAGFTKGKSRRGVVHHDNRGVLHRDGETIFPVGMYYIQQHLDDDGLLEEYASAGFNAIVWEWTDQGGYLGALKQMAPHGIDLILSITNEQMTYQLRQNGASEQRVSDHISSLTRVIGETQPTNLLAWYVIDEPDLDGLELTRRWSDRIAASDPYHPTLVCLCFKQVLRPFAPVVDILAPDPYPGFPGGPITKVSDFLVEANRAVRGRKPVIAVLQAFGAHGPGEPVLPTPTELRSMTYLALVHEARGILYFSYSYNGPMREKYPEQWVELKKLASQIRSLKPALVSTAGRLQARQLNHTDDVHSRVIEHQQKAYLIAVNTQRQAIEGVQWEAEGFTGPLDVRGAGRQICMTDGRLRDDFEPLAVHVYVGKSH